MSFLILINLVVSIVILYGVYFIFQKLKNNDNIFSSFKNYCEREQAEHNKQWQYFKDYLPAQFEGESKKIALQIGSVSNLQENILNEFQNVLRFKIDTIAKVQTQLMPKLEKIVSCIELLPKQYSSHKQVCKDGQESICQKISESRNALQNELTDFKKEALKTTEKHLETIMFCLQGNRKLLEEYSQVKTVADFFEKQIQPKVFVILEVKNLQMSRTDISINYDVLIEYLEERPQPRQIYKAIAFMHESYANHNGNGKLKRTLEEAGFCVHTTPGNGKVDNAMLDFGYQLLKANKDKFQQFCLITGDKSFTALARMMELEGISTEILYPHDSSALARDLKDAVSSVHFIDEHYKSKGAGKPLLIRASQNRHEHSYKR